MLVVALRGRPGLDSGVGEGVNPAVFSPFATKLCEVGVLRGQPGYFSYGVSGKPRRYEMRK